VRAAARLIVEEALEEEVTDALGREFYEQLDSDFTDLLGVSDASSGSPTDSSTSK